jgi:hypothetical protein
VIRVERAWTAPGNGTIEPAVGASSRKALSQNHTIHRD